MKASCQIGAMLLAGPGFEFSFMPFRRSGKPHTKDALAGEATHRAARR